MLQKKNHVIDSKYPNTQPSIHMWLLLSSFSFLSLASLFFTHTHTQHSLYWGIYRNKYVWKTAQITTWVVNFTDATSSDFQPFFPIQLGYYFLNEPTPFWFSQ